MKVKDTPLFSNIAIQNPILYPCHTIAYDTSVCQRMNKISHTLVHADKRQMNVRHRSYMFKERPRTAAYAGIR